MDTRNSFFVSLSDLPLTEEPFSAILPFADFTIRGGAPGLPDFTTVKSLEFDFFFNLPRVPVTMWSAEIRQIRLGRVVPEPATWVLGGFTAMPLTIRRQRHQD